MFELLEKTLHSASSCWFFYLITINLPFNSLCWTFELNENLLYKIQSMIWVSLNLNFPVFRIYSTGVFELLVYTEKREYAIFLFKDPICVFTVKRSWGLSPFGQLCLVITNLFFYVSIGLLCWDFELKMVCFYFTIWEFWPYLTHGHLTALYQPV